MISEIATLSLFNQLQFAQLLAEMKGLVMEEKPWVIHPGPVVNSDNEDVESLEPMLDRTGKFRIHAGSAGRPWFRLTIWDQRNALTWAEQFLTILAKNDAKWISITTFGRTDVPEHLVFSYGEEYKGDLKGLWDGRVLTTQGCLRFIRDVKESSIMAKYEEVTRQLDAFVETCKGTRLNPILGFEVARSLISGFRDPNFYPRAEEMKARMGK